MEYIDIFDQNNNPTGEIKEKTQAHEDGNFHRTAHIHMEVYKPLLELIEEAKQNPREQSFSKFCLGAYYYFGFGGIKRDINKAFELIHDCAMQGHLPAIYDLGANFYYNGIGTEQTLIPNAGHINSESGYDTFEDIANYI